MTEHLTPPDGRRLALVRTAGSGPAVVFLGGFRSDMEGTKALHLEAWARRAGHAFVRFDYSGHGASEGAFEEGCIGDWRDDAAAVIDSIGGPVILVGSSMGGWISLLLARDRPDLVAGLVTIAAAPDFTEDGYAATFTAAQHAELARAGVVHLPSEYGEPYPITRRLIEEGRKTLVLRTPLRLAMPVRFLQGTADPDVDQSVAHRLLAHAEGPDMRLTLVKGADHRFSTPECLVLIEESVKAVLQRV